MTRWEGPMYGALGVRTFDDDKMECHVCGRCYRSVAGHAVQAHGLPAHKYKELFGLSDCRGLVGKATHDLMAHNAMRAGQPALRALIKHGPPDRAAGLRGAHAVKRTEFGRSVGARLRGVPLSAEHRAKSSATRLQRRPELSVIYRQVWENMPPHVRRERVAALRAVAYSNSSKTHCKRGHPFDEANTYRPASGQRFCRECGRMRARQARGKALEGTGVLIL
jgi:hypothetical protein